MTTEAYRQKAQKWLESVLEDVGDYTYYVAESESYKEQKYWEKKQMEALMAFYYGTVLCEDLNQAKTTEEQKQIVRAWLNNIWQGAGKFNKRSLGAGSNKYTKLLEETRDTALMTFWRAAALWGKLESMTDHETERDGNQE